MRLIGEIVEAMYLYMEAKNINQAKFAKKLGIAPSSLGRWLKGTQRTIKNQYWEKLEPLIRPYIKEIQKKPVEGDLKEESPSTDLSPDDLILLRQFRFLSPENKKKMLSTATKIVEYQNFQDRTTIGDTANENLEHVAEDSEHYKTRAPAANEATPISEQKTALIFEEEKAQPPRHPSLSWDEEFARLDYVLDENIKIKEERQSKKPAQKAGKDTDVKKKSKKT